MLKVIRSGFCFLILLFNFNSHAAPTLKDYGALPTTSMVEISPDASLVAFRTVKDNQDYLTVISLKEKKKIMLLDLSKIQPENMYFISNQQLYLVVSEYGRVEGFKGKFATSTGFVVDIKTKKFRQLLIPGQDGVYPGQTGLGGIVGFSEDGEYAFMPAYLGSTEWLAGDTVKPKYGLIKVKLTNKARHKTTGIGSLYSENFFIDQNGNLLAEERYNDKTNEHSIMVFKSGKKEPEELFKEIVSIRNKSFLAITADYKSLVFTETNDETGRRDYYLMDLSTGKISTTAYGRDNADISNVIADKNQIARGIVYSGFSPSYHFFDAALDTRIKTIVATFPEQSVHIASTSPNWKNIVVRVEGSQFADDYFLFADGSNEPQYLASSRSNINSADIHPIGKVTYAAQDGLKIPTLITIPKDKLTSIKNLPAVIYPHGGPESYDTISFDFFAQALAANGYLVIQPQFRGSSGFGRAHTVAGYGEWGQKMQDDLTDAVKFFAAKGFINPEKVCIVGASYGGYAALAGGAFTPDIYKCVVSINGIGHIGDMLHWDKQQNGKDSWIVTYMEKQFGKGEIDKAKLAKISPEEFASSFKAPVLLIHSEDDKRVPFSQSKSMHSALKSKNKSAELIELEGDNHYLLESKTRLQALEATVNFVNKHLK
jgi:prolyl oligopeptidase PreP (S9A serine peptidase family)